MEYIKDEDIFLSGLNYALYPLKSNDQIINDNNILTGEGGEPWGIVVGRRYNRVEKVSIPIEGGENLTYYKHDDEDEGVPVTLGELFTDSESVLLFCKKYNEFITLLYELFLSRGAERRMDPDEISRDVREFKEWSMLDVNITLNLFNNKHTRRVCYYNLLGSFYNFVSFFDITRVRSRYIFGFEGGVFGNTWMSEIFGEGIQSSINLYFGDDNLLEFNPFYNNAYSNPYTDNTIERLVIDKVLLLYNPKERHAERALDGLIREHLENERMPEDRREHLFPVIKKEVLEQYRKEEEINNEFYNMASITSDFYPIGRKPHPIHIVTYEDKEIALKIGDTMIWVDDRITGIIEDEREWDEGGVNIRYNVIAQFMDDTEHHKLSQAHYVELMDSPLSVYTYDIIDGVNITYEDRLDEIIEKVTEMRYIASEI